MNASTASNYPDPFIDIIKLRFPTDLCKTLQDSELIQIYETIDFPSLQAAEIETISKRISSGLSYNESMKNCSYLFPFRPSSLQVIENKCPQNGSKQSQFAVCFILHSYAAFCLFLEKNQSISYLPILLQSLNSIRDVTPLAIKAFVRAISYYAIIHDFYQIKLFIPLISDFFSNANLNGFVAFDVFSDLFINLTKNCTEQLPDDALELYTLLSSISEQKLNALTQTASEKILCSIKFLIVKMDFYALDLAAHISPFVRSEYISDLCKIAVPIFADQITSENPILTINFPEEPAVKLGKPEQIMQPVYFFQQFETFPNGFKIISLDRLPERENISLLCQHVNVTSKINYFLKIINNHEAAAATFLETFEDSIAISAKNPHFFDLMADFLNASLILSEKVKLPHMVRFLFSDILFDPRLICSMEDQKTYKLNSMRSAAFELVLNEGPEALEFVLTESMPYPQLYSELIYRCVIYRSLVGSLLLQSSKLLHIIVTSALYYQKYCFLRKIDVDSVRLSIFLFFSFFFNKRKIESFIFNDSYFISSFLSFIFEEKVRPFILTQLKSYLTKDNQKVLPLIGEKISLIFDIIEDDFPSTKSVNRLNDIFSAIIDSLSHQHKLAETFKPIIGPIIKFLSLLINTKECKDLLLNTLQFFAIIAHEYTLSSKQLNMMEIAILTVFGKNPPQDVFNGLIQILNGDTISSTNPTFIIRQPLVLPTFLRIFINTPRCTEVIKYIFDLCSYTTTNAISCHTSGLDFLLLEFLHSSSFDDESSSSGNRKRYNDFDDKTIELILELFSKIALLISSPDVVSLYLSLLSPIANKGLPKHFDKILLTLNSIVSSSLKSPITSIPFPKEASPMEPKININDGFTFAAWIQLDSNDSHFKPYLFTLNSSSNNKSYIRISLSSNIINIYQRTNRSESSARADRVIPLNQWSFICIVYKICNGNAQCIVSINGRDSRPLTFPIFNPLGDSNSHENSFSFFGVSDESIDPKVPVLIGPFAVFPLLDPSTIAQLLEHGPRQLNRMTIHPFFTYIPQILIKPMSSSIFKSSISLDTDDLIPKKNDENPKNENESDSENGSESENESESESENENETKNDEDDEDDNEINTFINNPSTTTFLNVLINNCKVTILLPLFSLFDFRNDLGKAFQSISDVTIELISNSLLMSVETEIQFAQLHGFEIISELLMEANFTKLNYSTYLRFFSLLQMLRTPELQNQLIRTILGNIELWIVSDAENQLRILKHWARVLYLTNSPTDDFSTFLSNTVLYYWDDVCDRNYLKGLPGSPRPRPSNLKASKCRSYMIDILLIMSQRSFDLNDFDLLMSYIKESPDKGTFLSLASLVLMMSKIDLSPLSVAIGTGDGNKISNSKTDPSIKSTTNDSPEIPLFGYKSSTLAPANKLEAIKEKTEKFLALLHQLFERKIPELTKMLIETICMLHANKILTNPPFDIHIEIIIHRLKSSMITQELFEYLYYNLLPTIPQLLPLCFWLAFNISEVTVAQLVSNIEPSENYAIGDCWALWPIIIAFKTSVSVKSSILVFLAKCGYKQWMNVYSTIIIVGSALDEDYYSLISLFLTYLSNCLLCQMIPSTSENLESFFNLARHFLLFRDPGENLRELESAFRFSPFSANVPSQQQITNNHVKTKHAKRSKSLVPSDASEITSMRPLCENDPTSKKSVKANSFTNKIITFNGLPHSYSFGLRLDDRLRWIDLSLAQNTMFLVGATGFWPALDIDLIICSFIFRTIPSMVLSHLQGLKIPPKIVEQYQIYIDLFCFKALVNKTNCELNKYKSKYFIYNASIALFETVKWNMSSFTETPKRILKSIKEFYKKFNNINPIIDIDVDDEFNCYHSSMKNSLSNKTNEIIMNKKFWNQLWNAVTTSGSIWEKAVNEKDDFIRNKIGCYCHCPFKTKPNINYTQVIDSFVRPDFDPNSVLIANSKEYEGEFLLFNEKIEICLKNNFRKTIFYSDIAEILPRTRFHKKNSIEIFMKNNNSYFISFYDSKFGIELAKYNQNSLPLNEFIIERIVQLEPRLSKRLGNIDNLCSDWVNRKITNFEYLSELNKIGGRSFNDLAQYPIFPWVVKDYSCQAIKLDEISLYRDLRRPIGTLNDERIKKLRENSEEMKSMQNSQGTKLPYLYKSGPSSEKIVREFLSKIFKDKSDNKFINDFNTLTSVPDAFNHVISEVEDFRELIPEFYFQPEVFQGVDLPIWSSNPIEFVYLNRKVLESEYVSSNLCSWIDFIWGFQNRGREAIKSENSYMSELYDNNEESEVDSDLLRERGIIPPQLFNSKHPQQIPLINFKNSDCLTIDAKTSSIAFSNIYTIHEENKIIIKFIDASGILKTNVFSFGKNNEGRINSIINVESSINDIEDFNCVSDSTLFSSISGSLILVSDDSLSLPQMKASENEVLEPQSSSLSPYKQSTFILNTKSLTIQTILLEPSVCFASSYPYFAILGNEFLIKVYDIESVTGTEKPSFIIPFIRVSASCMAMSSIFHSIVVGGFEELLLYSISQTTLTKRIKLDEGANPLIIKISPSWGFIVVYATIEKTVYKKFDVDANMFDKISQSGAITLDSPPGEAHEKNDKHSKIFRHSSLPNLSEINLPVKEKVESLYTFSVNGELIRKKQLPFRIVAMTTWRSVNGFDFIAFATDRDKVYVYEAFFLDVGKVRPVMKCSSSIKELHYSEQLQILVVITKDGSFFFKPYAPNDTILYGNQKISKP